MEGVSWNNFPLGATVKLFPWERTIIRGAEFWIHWVISSHVAMTALEIMILNFINVCLGCECGFDFHQPKCVNYFSSTTVRTQYRRICPFSGEIWYFRREQNWYRIELDFCEFSLSCSFRCSWRCFDAVRNRCRSATRVRILRGFRERNLVSS